MVLLINESDLAEITQAYSDEYHCDLRDAIETDIAAGAWIKLVRSWLKEKNSNSSDAL